MKQAGLRVGIAFVNVDRLVVVPHVVFVLQRAGFFLSRGYQLSHERFELVHIVDSNGEHPIYFIVPCRRLYCLRVGPERKYSEIKLACILASRA